MVLAKLACMQRESTHLTLSQPLDTPVANTMNEYVAVSVKRVSANPPLPCMGDERSRYLKYQSPILMRSLGFVYKIMDAPKSLQNLRVSDGFIHLNLRDRVPVLEKDACKKISNYQSNKALVVSAPI